MSGDLGSDAGRARSRPSFLPPDDGGPPPAAEAVLAPLPPGPPRRGTPWLLAMLAAALTLLVSAFLPWAHAQVVIDLFGRTLTRDVGTVAGINADGMILAVPVLAVIAITMAFWDLIARNARIGGLAAVPGVLALLVCGIFVLRLGDVRDNLPDTGLDLGYQITIRYGWYLAVLASLFLIGFSLARPLGERMSRPRPEQQYTDQYPYAAQQPYPDQQYGTGEYPAWPDEAQAWGREPEARQDEPAKEQHPPPEQHPPQEQRPPEERTD